MLVAERETEQMAVEAPCERRIDAQMGLTAALRALRHALGVVVEERPPQPDVEIQTAQVAEVVAEAHAHAHLAVTDHGHVRPRYVDTAVATVAAVLVGHFALKGAASEILAGGDPHPVQHAAGRGLDPETVAQVGVYALVVRISGQIARTRMLRGDVEVAQRIERPPRPQLQIERTMAVELPVGHRSGTYGLHVEARGQRLRSDRIVDVGPQHGRVDHARFERQFQGGCQIRHVVLGHLDVFFHLRPHRGGQQQEQANMQYESLHLLRWYQLSPAMRRRASSTIPSSAGE